MSMFSGMLGGQTGAQAAPPDPTMYYQNYFPQQTAMTTTTPGTDNTTPIPSMVSPILQQNLPNVLQSPASSTANLAPSADDLNKGKTNVGVGPNGMSIGV